jgi:hypothetical protein
LPGRIRTVKTGSGQAPPPARGRNLFLASSAASGYFSKMLQTKLAQVQAAMRAGDWPRAFSIASKLGRLGPQRGAILRAQSAALSPGLYR